MSKRLPHTPTSKIKAALRQLDLRSRERAARLKQDDYRCQVCGGKQSKAKGREFAVQVHHIDRIKWDDIINYIREQLLVGPEQRKTLCDSCHNDEHEGEFL